jgi:DNA-binding beta-propeller fold protein YncE
MFFYVCARTCLLALATTASIPPPAVAQGPAYLTQWGTSGTGNGQFMNPVGVAINAAGEVYVADQGNRRIQKFSGTGAYLMQWELPGGDGYFDRPEGVATNAAGDVYVGDSGLHRIQKFSGAGTYIDEWFGSADPAFGWYLPIVAPVGVAIGSNGAVYVADAGNGYVQKFPGDGGHAIDKSVGGRPSGIAVDAAGNAYVTFQDNTVQKFASDLTILTQWGSSGSGNGQFEQPRGVTVDASGNVYVVDSSNNRIQKFSGTGDYLGGWGSSGSGDGQFMNPVGVAINAAGEVYVADQGNNRVQKFGLVPTPTKATSWGRLKRLFR